MSMKPAILDRLRGVERAGTGWLAFCPAHHDERRRSLSVGIGDDGKTLLKCHAAGCTAEQIAAAVGMTLADLRGTNGDRPVRRQVVATYDYTDESGALLYQSVRLEPKDFRQRRPDGQGGWTWNLADVPSVPYRLPELAEAPRVFVAEGEKDVDALAGLGFVATCNHGGAGKWRDEHTQALVSASVPEVVVLPDNDAAGEKHAAIVACSCSAAGLRVKVMRLPDLPNKGDVSDYIATERVAGRTEAEIRAALETLADAAPVFVPANAEFALAASAIETAAGDPWPAPQPIPAELPAVPPFDADRLLPPVLAQWTVDVTERAQCPPEFAAIGALVAAGAVVGRQVTIRPKCRDDWSAVPNLWGLGIGQPGVMKSAAMAESLRGVHHLCTEARKAHKDALAAHGFNIVEAKARRAAVEKKLKAAAEKNEPTDGLRQEFEAAVVPDPPVERRYLVNDSTVEKLGALLNEHPNGLLLFRDELSGLLRSMDREGHENDRAFYCEAWNGTGRYVYDRIGRGTLHVEAACVSILGAIQPAPLAAYLREAFGAGQDDGLIQRFQLMVYPDIARDWRNVDRWPDSDARRRVVDVFKALDRLDPETIAAHRDADDELPFLRFTPEAQVRFDDWRANLEKRLRTDDDHPILTSHLAKYRSLCPSLALLFHLIDCVDRGLGGPVSDAAVERAISWCEFLEPHARRVYEGVITPERQSAGALAKKIAAGELQNPFVTRDVRRKGWTGLTTPEEVAGAVSRLEELGWLRRTVVRLDGGGRPTTRYTINPAVVRK